MKCGGIVGMHELDDAGLQIGKRSEASPGQLLLQILPHPLDRINLRRVRWLEQQDDILRNTQPLGRMTPRVIEQQHVERVRPRPRKLIEQAVDVVLIELGQAEQAAVTTSGRDGAIQGDVLAAVVGAANRLHAARRTTPPSDGLYPEATRSAGPDCDGAGRVRWHDRLEVLGSVATEGRHAFRVFLCDWVAGL